MGKKMKVELTVLDRATLLQSLPESGDFLTLKILRKMKEKLSLTEEEIKFFDLKYVYTCIEDSSILHSLTPINCPKCNKPMQMGGGVIWNPQVKQDIEMEFNEMEESIIQSSLKKLNDSKQLTEKHLSLYEMFVGA